MCDVELITEKKFSINNRTHYRVQCKTHGLCYLQRVDYYTIGQLGCPIGKKIKQSKAQTKDKKHYVSQFRKIHGDKYDYSLVESNGSRSKIKVICPEHGVFEVRTSHHICGNGCSVCAGNQRKTTEQFIKEANKIHNNKYGYTKTNYVAGNKKVIITCPLHGDFSQQAMTHTNGSGCPKCFKRAGAKLIDFIECCKKNNGYGFLYVIRCWNETEEFYKIGITSTSIKYRFRGNISLPYKYEIIHNIKDKAENVYNAEKFLHKLFKDYAYQPYLKFKGYTECFQL